MDHAASTPVLQDVEAVWIESSRSLVGNASAEGHWHGELARRAIEAARHQVAALVGAEPAGVVFTSGSTEASALAIQGLIGRAHAVTTTGEHPAVGAWFDRYAAQDDGIEVTRIPCDERGVVSIDAVVDAVRPTTSLVSVIYGHNETAAITDLENLGQRLRGGPCIHSDVTQALGTQPVDLEAWGLGALSLSGHKIGAPKGVGALALSLRALDQLRKVSIGGGQQGGMRSGTLNTPGIVALGHACRLLREQRGERAAHLSKTLSRFWGALSATYPQVQLLGPKLSERRLPNIASIRFPGIPARLLQAEVRHEVTVGVGSACASGSVQASPSLLACGLPPEQCLEVIRASFSPEVSGEEVDTAANCLAAAAQRLGG